MYWGNVRYDEAGSMGGGDFEPVSMRNVFVLTRAKKSGEILTFYGCFLIRIKYR